jgi:hypothetical protein
VKGTYVRDIADYSVFAIIVGNIHYKLGIFDISFVSQNAGTILL